MTYQQMNSKSILIALKLIAKSKHLFLTNSFEHRQYSGYISKESMNERSVAKLARKLNKQLSWLCTCVQHFDATDIGEQHDLTHLFTNKALHKDKDLTKQANTIDAKDINPKAIESMKQKITELEKSDKLNKITNKRNKNKDRGH